MSASAARACHAARSLPGVLRRVILSDPAGVLLGEVSLPLSVPGKAIRRPAAQLLSAVGPNQSDRAPTGDALHVVIGRRACFGYAVDVDRVRWFSHPRLARADAFDTLEDRDVRRFLYCLHADDPDIVSEIIWETSGRVRAHRAPALPAGIDPRVPGSLVRDRDGAAYWAAVVRILTGGTLEADRARVVRRRSCVHVR